MGGIQADPLRQSKLSHNAAMSAAGKAMRQSIEAEKRKQQEFSELAQKVRKAVDPEETKRLGDMFG